MTTGRIVGALAYLILVIPFAIWRLGRHGGRARKVGALIEIAIAIVVVGLLLGGVLKSP